MPEEKKETVESLQKKVEACEKVKKEYLAGWQRARADFLNYKKEEMERIGEILKYAGEELVLKILPVLDNFEKAEKEIPKEKKEDNCIEGLLKIKIQLHDFLKNMNVEEIKSVGKKFDPNFHEAVEEIEQKDKEPGIIIEETQKGYLMNGNLLRPAKVKVAR